MLPPSARQVCGRNATRARRLCVLAQVTNDRPVMQHIMSDIAMLHGEAPASFCPGRRCSYLPAEHSAERRRASIQSRCGLHTTAESGKQASCCQWGRGACAGLGVRLVVVVGAQETIDAMLKERSLKPTFVGGYRITDKDTLKIAVEAAGQVRTMCEQFLSKVRLGQSGAQLAALLWPGRQDRPTSSSGKALRNQRRLLPGPAARRAAGARHPHDPPAHQGRGRDPL